ncbi:MAG: SDR family NAD(P)-dependent oxidoreductase [Dehalococcoidales bacterium]|nr:SDR family NAD(P)-dependent oxidoreductase [Dehalococcoidales bacterium]
MSSLKGKVALVTGAASKRGMGRAIAVRLAKEGANVAVLDKFMAPKSIWPGDEGWGGLNAVVEEIKAQGKDGLALEADVCSGKEVDDAVAKAIDKFGKIDILVHCGGIRGAMTTPVTELSEEDWRAIIDINLTGSFLISKAVAKTMIPDGEGKKIVLIGSKAATQGYAGSSGYCASKHGVLGFGRTLAAELAKYKINVNIINPGGFETNLRDQAIIERAKTQGIPLEQAVEEESKKVGPGPSVPLGRLGKPEEIADLVYFLVSGQSAYITGKAIDIDGGA